MKFGIATFCYIMGTISLVFLLLLLYNPGWFGYSNHSTCYRTDYRGRVEIPCESIQQQQGLPVIPNATINWNVTV